MIIGGPPRGFNTWNTFGADINEKMIFEIADTMVEKGLLDSGYEHLIIDDIWSLKERNENGELVPDPEKFPNGMKYVADYVHSKGLKFGMYSCAGYLTCAGYPGSYGYEWKDAMTFASWEVDYLKYDFCFHPVTVSTDTLYKRMSLALSNCGRDILFSACSWGSAGTSKWIAEAGAHAWRSSLDIFDSWESVKKHSIRRIERFYENSKGCYNDMDMLVVGMNGQGNVGLTGCTDDEYRLHFALWAFMSSPLIIGCDIRTVEDKYLEMIKNKELLDINSDPLCAQPFIANNTLLTWNENVDIDTPFYSGVPTDITILGKYLSNGDIALGAFNFTDEEASKERLTVLIDKLGLPVDCPKKLVFKDVFTGEELTMRSGAFIIPPLSKHSCRVYRGRFV